ncbi:uncharacterized protein LOC131262854 isoform X2 [Anopheles coustani]|uniref:uncharacterized protein LOC131262854 isoform X2 n=1 Tax=Anopheles coustani TaxID=139045 RepID=UPI00265A7BFB|nr:uncharacterized protein LOC131262854 isoform X2 [Anopheles coustani]
MSANSPCRVCSQEKSVDQLVDIFETNCHPGTIAEMIIELTGLKVKENDGLPSLCCVQCHSDLIISITIRRKCIYSDNIMRALLQSTFVWSPWMRGF